MQNLIREAPRQLPTSSGNFYVVWYSPVTKASGIVATTEQGVDMPTAQQVVEESERKFKPLQYTVQSYA